jgi:hypothetical protein
MVARFTWLFVALLWCHSSFSQTIENIRARTEGTKIIIQYDLKVASVDFPIVPQNDFWVEIKAYSSHNFFAAPLANVVGAIGKVAPGNNKQIEWQYGNVLDNFSGDLSFEIGAEVIFHLKFIAPKQSIRRGKDNSFAWNGGRLHDQIHFELISSAKDVVWETTALSETGILNLKTERSLPVGKGYQLQMTSKDEQVTIPIKVKRKVARFWLVSPVVVAAGAVVYFVWLKQDPLPIAPGPPN